MTGLRPRRALTAPARRRAVIIGIASLGLAGCGTATYNSSALDQLIRSRLDAHRGFQVRSVSCPSDAKLAKGVVIACTASLRGGHVVRLRATELDDKGSVHLVANEMFPDNVERGIDVALAHRGIRVRSVCPQHVLVVVGKTFRCRVTDNSGTRFAGSVTIVDGDGGFRVRFP